MVSSAGTTRLGGAAPRSERQGALRGCFASVQFNVEAGKSSGLSEGKSVALGVGIGSKHKNGIHLF